MLWACGARRDIADVLVLEGTPKRGQALYQMHCARCHGAEGGGIASNPALSKTTLTLRDPDIVDIMLNGKGGMPAQRLDEQQTADVLAWMRATWL